MPSIFSSSKGSSSSPRQKKCTISCGFLNLPQASEGTYQCHGSKKNGRTPCPGTYEVTRAEATLVMDLHRAQMRKEESEAHRQKPKGRREREGHVGSASTPTRSSGKDASGRHGKPLPPIPTYDVDLNKPLPRRPPFSGEDQNSHSLPFVLSRQRHTPKRKHREELALGSTWQNALNMGVPSTSAKGGYNPELEVKEMVKAQPRKTTTIQPGDNRRSVHTQIGHFPIPEVLVTEGQSWYREAPPPLPTKTWYPKRRT